MYFEFEKLDVYQASVDFVVVADAITEAFPRGRAYLKDQLRRAANSIPANIAEGVGEFAANDKARFYRIARRSAVECASHLLISQRLGLVDDRPVMRGRELLLRIVAMLTSMAKSVAARLAPEPTRSVIARNAQDDYPKYSRAFARALLGSPDGQAKILNDSRFESRLASQQAGNGNGNGNGNESP